MSFFVPLKRPATSGFKAPIVKSYSISRHPEIDDLGKTAPKSSASELIESENEIPVPVGPDGDSLQSISSQEIVFSSQQSQPASPVPIVPPAKAMCLTTSSRVRILDEVPEFLKEEFWEEKPKKFDEIDVSVFEEQMQCALRSFKLSNSRGEDTFSQSDSEVAAGNSLKMTSSQNWDIATLVEKEFFKSTQNVENAAISTQNISDDTTDFFVASQKETNREIAAISDDDDDDAFPSTQDMDGVFTSTQNDDLNEENFQPIHDRTLADKSQELINLKSIHSQSSDKAREATASQKITTTLEKVTETDEEEITDIVSNEVANTLSNEVTETHSNEVTETLSNEVIETISKEVAETLSNQLSSEILPQDTEAENYPHTSSLESSEIREKERTSVVKSSCENPAKLPESKVTQKPNKKVAKNFNIPTVKAPKQKNAKKSKVETATTSAMPARTALAKPKASAKRPTNENDDTSKVSKKRKGNKVEIAPAPNLASGEKFYAIKSLRNMSDLWHGDASDNVVKKNVVVARKSAPKPVDDDEQNSQSQDSLGPRNTWMSKPSGSAPSTAKKRKIESSRDRLRLIQKLRQDDGTWVECCVSCCKKWRYLSYIKDPAQVPKYWSCSMNKDAKLNSCDSPQQPFDKEEELVICDYTVGSIVWAHLTGYPWWPALVDDDPDTETFYWPDSTEDSFQPEWYHVVFFDHFKTSVSRAWIRSSSMTSFIPGKSCGGLPPHPVPARMSLRFSKSVEQAEQAFDMDVLERRKRCSFLARYHGHWGDAINMSDDDQEQNTIDRYSQQEGRRKTGANKRRYSKSAKPVLPQSNIQSKIKYKPESSSNLSKSMDATEAGSQFQRNDKGSLTEKPFQAGSESENLVHTSAQSENLVHVSLQLENPLEAGSEKIAKTSLESKKASGTSFSVEKSAPNSSSPEMPTQTSSFFENPALNFSDSEKLAETGSNSENTAQTSSGSEKPTESGSELGKTSSESAKLAESVEEVDSELSSMASQILELLIDTIKD